MTLKTIITIALAIFIGNAKAVASNKKTSGMKNKTTITILQTSDIHGQLDTHEELFVENGKVVFKQRGGMARIKTLFDKERAANPGRTFIVDAGDLIQGSGYAAASEGRIFSKIVQKMNYDLMLPGNWEVVYGKGRMMEVLGKYNTPVIAQNMRHESSGEYLFPPYRITEIDGIKLAFIGVNDPDIPFRQAPSYSKGIQFNGLDDSLKEVTEKVKSEENPNLIFLVTHIGIFKQVDLASNPLSRDVNYILGADTHERIRKPIEGKFAKVTEPGAFGSFVGKLTLHFEDGKLISDEYELLEVDPDIYPEDKELQSVIDRLKKPYEAELEKVVGYTSEPLYRYLTVENAMDNMITDAMRWKTGVDISLSNGFRFGNPIVPRNGKPAPINRNDIWNMLPIDDFVKTGKVTGKQIKEWLEKEAHNVFAKNPTERFGGWFVRFSGMEVRLNSSNERGNRIESITVQGKPIDYNKTYTISACLREGDPDDMLCRIPNVKDVKTMDYTMHEVLIEYLGKFSPVAPKIDGRALATDLGEFTFSTLPGTDYEFR